VTGAGRSGGSGFAAQNVEHDRAAGGHLPLMALRPFFMVSSTALTNFLLGLAFNAISFRHKFFYGFALHVRSRNGEKLKDKRPPTQPGKENRRFERINKQIEFLLFPCRNRTRRESLVI